MLYIVLLGFIVSALLVPFGKYFRGRLSGTLACIPFFIFCYFLSKMPLLASGGILTAHHSWVPSLGLNLDFRLDGVSLLFSLLISGIGTLVFFYASSYLKGHPYLDRFLGFLSLFMASMLGVVLSNNILLIFVFWELTSISSFFLIGFNNKEKASRRSAITALCLTGLGGFFLLSGFVLLGQIGGTYVFQELLDQASFFKQHELYPLIIALIFIGAFTKSAQFPFHFWLPDAMKAPTPVSAYLHSATMVKAGIFLLIRFTPVLGGTSQWMYTLLIVGGITMLYAAFQSLFRTDLKSVLAYSTIAVLGILTFLIGLGTEQAITAALTFILAHALYKATLFLTTGIIDKQTSSRNLVELRGLRKVLFPVFLAASLAALSSGGMPLFLGFIGKDLIYAATLSAGENLSLWLTLVAVLANIGLVTAGFLAGFKPFIGKLNPAFKDTKKPEISLWLPPVLLATLGLVLGLFPGLAGKYIVNPGLKVVSFIENPEPLRIWHGLNLVLLLSLLTLGIGAALFHFNRVTQQKENNLLRFETWSPKAIFSSLWTRFKRFGYQYTEFMHNGYLRSYLIRCIIFAELLLAFELFKDGPFYIDYQILSPISFFEVVVTVILTAALFLIVSTPSRLTAVVGTSVVGYVICLMFVWYGAPDLAMTQFSIDTLTVVLFVYVLFNLPPFLKFPTRNKKVIVRDSIVALSFGVLLSLIAIRVLQVPTSTEIRDFYGDFAYTLAKGRNVVNVILVDFRGFDTMFEIIVLSIAGLGVYSLIKLKLKPSDKE